MDPYSVSCVQSGSGCTSSARNVKPKLAFLSSLSSSPVKLSHTTSLILTLDHHAIEIIIGEEQLTLVGISYPPVSAKIFLVGTFATFSWYIGFLVGTN